MIPPHAPFDMFDTKRAHLEAIDVSNSTIVSIIDDDKSLRNALVDLLSTCGFEAEGFETAESFLSSDMAERTELLVTDIEMPGMDGFQLADQMTARRAGLPVILMTGGKLTRRKDRTAASNDYCLLKKPFQSQRLLNCIDDALAHRPLSGD